MIFPAKYLHLVQGFPMAMLNNQMVTIIGMKSGLIYQIQK